MNWRATNTVDEIVINSETYVQLCNHIKSHKLTGEWTVEYYDSNLMWIEMDSINVAVDTGELSILKGSHLEHF